jgi:cell division protein FtsB
VDRFLGATSQPSEPYYSNRSHQINYSLHQQIEAAHAEAERIEAEALQLEARIVRAGGVPPRRKCGKPVSTKAIRQNLTLTGLINSRDPQVTSYLGIQSGAYAREQAERAKRQAAIESLQQATAALQQRNQLSQLNRERAAIAGINPATGSRLF